VAGLKGHLSSDLSPGFGYTGIIVAMLALLHPLGVVLTAIFVAGIFVGSDAMSRAAGVPTYIADMLMATALLFMVLAILLTGPGGAGMSAIDRHPDLGKLLGGRDPHRLAADPGHDGGADLRTRRAC
jgi:ABC-type uncharacterized transport system permease subunit